MNINWKIVWSVILGFLVGLGIGYAVWYTVPEVEAGDGGWRDITSCEAIDCGTSEGLKTQARTTTEYAEAICPTWYHYHNNGNWNQRCHRDYNWVHPEHKAPIACPKDYEKKDNRCVKETYEERVVECKAEIVACPVTKTLVCLDGEEELTIPRTTEAWERVLFSWPNAYVGECKVPDVPVTLPEPEVEHHASMPGAPAGRCHASTHPVIVQAVATRNGTSANIAYVPTAGENEPVNVVYAENPFEIILGLGEHGLRDWTPNNGNVQLNDLVEGQSYWYRIANGCSWWSEIFFIQ